MGKAGRPTGTGKLTSGVHKAVVKNVREGNWIYTSAKALGIGRRTIARWMQIGKGEHPTIKASEPYISFANDVEEAFAQAEIEIVSTVKNAEDWRAQAWLLERGPARDRWSQNVNITAQLAPAASILDTLRERSLTDGNLEPLEVEVKEIKEPENAQSRQEEIPVHSKG